MGRKNNRSRVAPAEVGECRYCLHAANGDLLAVIWPGGEGETVLDLFATAAAVPPACRERATRDLVRLVPEWTHDEAYDLLWGE